MGRRLVAATLALLLTMFGCGAKGDGDTGTVESGEARPGASAADVAGDGVDDPGGTDDGDNSGGTGDGSTSGSDDQGSAGDASGDRGGDGSDDNGDGVDGGDGVSGDGTSGDGTSGDGDDAAQPVSMRKVSDRTCHDRNTAGGNSDVEVIVEVTGIPDGTTISTDWRVNSDPPPRPASGVVTDGRVTFIVAALAEREVGVIGNAAIGDDPEGPEQIPIDGDLGFTVADLGDPNAQCGTT